MRVPSQTPRLLAALVVAGSLTLAPFAGAAPLVRMTAPVDDTVVTGGESVAVTGRTAPGVRTVALRVNDRRRSVRVRDRAIRVDIPARTLRPGSNLIALIARSGSRTTIRTAHVTRARRDQGIARLLSPARDATLGAPVALAIRGPRDARTRVVLNGRVVPDAVTAGPRGVRRATLAAHDGLRFGRNRIVVTMLSADDRLARFTRTVTVRPDRPIPSAGRDVAVSQPGQPAVLDGRASTLPLTPTTRAEARAAGRITYRWRLASKPRGARARLSGASTSRPRLVADRPGLYRVRLVVGPKGGPRGVDDALVAVENGPYLSAQVGVVQGGLFGIAVQGQLGLDEQGVACGPGAAVVVFCPSPAPAGVQAVVLDRTTLGFVANLGVPLTAEGIASLRATLAGYAPGQNIVLLASQGGGAVDPAAVAPLNQVAQAIGAEPLLSAAPATGPAFAVAGIVGLAPGQASQTLASGQAAGSSLDGALTWGSDGGYVFTYADPVLVDTASPTAPAGVPRRVMVGTTPADSDLAQTCGSGCGGFQLVTVDGVTGSVTANTSFATNIPGAPVSSEVQQWAALVTALKDAAAAPPGTIVALSTLNDPIDPQYFGGGGDIGGLVAPLGGTPGLLNQVVDDALNRRGPPAPGYSLVGVVGGEGIEAASAIAVPVQGSSAVLRYGQGGSRAVVTLAREETGRYGILGGIGRADACAIGDVTCPTTAFDLGLVRIADQPAQSWTEVGLGPGGAPVPSTPGQSAAYACVSAYVYANSGTTSPLADRTDLRKSYVLLGLPDGFWGDKQTQVEAMAFAQRRSYAPECAGGFTGADLQAVKAAVAVELADVDLLTGWLVGNQPGGGWLPALFAGSGQQATTVSEVAQQVDELVKAPGGGDTFLEVLDLTSQLAVLAGAYEFPESARIAGNLLNALAGALGASKDTIEDVNEGGVDLLDEVDTTAQDLEADYATAAYQLGPAFENLFSVLVSDPGKLAAAETYLASQTVTAPQVELMQSSLATAVLQQSYAALVPVAETLWSLQATSYNPAGTTPAGFRCTAVLGGSPPTRENWQPFAGAPAGGQLQVIDGWTQQASGLWTPTYAYEALYSRAAGDVTRTQPSPGLPPASVVDPITQAPSQLLTYEPGQSLAGVPAGWYAPFFFGRSFTAVPAVCSFSP